jgi:hypothetical protein
MEQVAPRPAKVRQDFTVGNLVTIGGSKYRVTGRRPPPNKGEAAIIELVSPDLERRYEWQPFRGLRVIGAPPKRVRKKRARGASPTQRVERVSLWRRVFRALRPGH